MSIKAVARVDLDQLERVLNGQQVGMPFEGIQALDVVMRHLPSMRWVQGACDGVWGRGVRVIFLGSWGAKSQSRGSYYKGRGSDYWPGIGVIIRGSGMARVVW